jgi:hypothetical protein
MNELIPLAAEEHAGHTYRGIGKSRFPFDMKRVQNLDA